MTIFLEDIKELKNYDECKLHLVKCSVPFKEKSFANGIKSLHIKNSDTRKLTRGVDYGKRGGSHFYYLPNKTCIIIQNGYGFNGRGMPHSRSTDAKVFDFNGERNRDAEKEFLFNSETFIDKTVAQMEAIIKEKIFIVE